MSSTASGGFTLIQDPLAASADPTLVTLAPSSLPLPVIVAPGSVVGIDVAANTVQLDAATITALTKSDPGPQQTIKEVKDKLIFGAGVVAPTGAVKVPPKTIAITWFNLSPLLLTIKLSDGSELWLPPQGTYNFENLSAQKAGEDFNFSYFAAGNATVTSEGNSGGNFNGISPRLVVNFRTS